MKASVSLQVVLDLNPSQVATLKRWAINPSGFVFDPETGHSYSANSTAAALLKELQKTEDIETILKSIEETYLVDRDQLERDLVEFIEVLRSQCV